ncbi:MAG TPA: hypothetical protein VNC40_15005 [Gaiellaceae bacterium]|nr:hypothetical protein [Gaiellaceae bacterium]
MRSFGWLTTGKQRRPRVHGSAVAAIAGAVGVLGAWNAARYPPTLGYDSVGDLAYADGILHGRLPFGTGEFAQPPGFYAVAAVADRIARFGVWLGDPHRATMALDVALLIATTLLVWRIVLDLWPARPWCATVAALFVALLPVTERAAAMFHPETLNLFLSTLAIWLTLRLLHGRASPWAAARIGVVLGLAQLVRAFSLAILAAVLLTLLVSSCKKHAVLVLLVSLLVAAPWYVRQTVVYGTPFPFNRASPHTAIWNRRPLQFYVGLGLPAVLTLPYRPHFDNQAIPTTYSELWGDYFGHWVWNGSRRITANARAVLRLQSLAGLLPTLLAVGGWLALLLTARGRPGQLLIALVPLVGLVQYLVFTVSYPSQDGDVLKATYMLDTTAGWAAGFAYALARLPRRALQVAVAPLTVAAVVDLTFLVYR